MFHHFGHWFHQTQEILFAVEFLLVQLFVIVHLVRALFFTRR